MEDMSIKRSFEITYRSKQEDNKRIIQGYAVVFDTWADISDKWGDTWRECISYGAFAESLKNNKVLALYNHDFNNVIARKDVNMILLEDNKGLKFEIELPDTNQAKDLYELINRGIVNQCSFAGYVKAEAWEIDDESNISRTINEIDLVEITITPIPAYDVTEAEVKRSKIVRCEESKGVNLKKVLEQCKKNREWIKGRRGV